MGFKLDLENAAKRHMRCADHLASNHEAAEACYLVGLAAECALKAHLVNVGFKSHKKKRKKGAEEAKDPLYIHFPDLSRELLAQGEGSLGRSILTLIDDNLMRGWSVKMRYKHEQSTPAVKKKYAKWKSQAQSIFNEVGIP